MKPPRRTGKAATREKEEDSGSRSVRRALDILAFMLRRGEPVTVSQIISELSIPK